MSSQTEMSKRQMRREQIRRKEQRGRIIGISLITIGALFVAFLIIWPNVKPVTGITVVDPNPRPQADKNSMGDPNAPVRAFFYRYRTFIDRILYLNRQSAFHLSLHRQLGQPEY